MARIIALANQKGGVAKTTSTFNIATCLALKDQKVLMVDLDPQASLTIYAGLEPYEQEQTIVNVLKDTKADIQKCICPIRENLFIIPSRIELAGVEGELLSRTARELILSRALESIKSHYDFIIIDCPPQLATLTINGISCADDVLIPVKTDYLAYRGVEQLLETIETIRTYFKPALNVIGVLATMFESRIKDDNDVLVLLKEEYTVVGVIKSLAVAKKGMYDGKSTVEVAPSSDIALEYEKLCNQLIRREL